MLTIALSGDAFGRLAKHRPTARQPENLSPEGQLISQAEGAQLALRGWMIFLLEDYRAAGFFLSRAIPARARRHWHCNFFWKACAGVKGFFTSPFRKRERSCSTWRVPMAGRSRRST